MEIFLILTQLVCILITIGVDLDEYFVTCLLGLLPFPFDVVFQSIIDGFDDGGDILKDVCPYILETWSGSIESMCPVSLTTLNIILGISS